MGHEGREKIVILVVIDCGFPVFLAISTDNISGDLQLPSYAETDSHSIFHLMDGISCRHQFTRKKCGYSVAYALDLI